MHKEGFRHKGFQDLGVGFREEQKSPISCQIVLGP